MRSAGAVTATTAVITRNTPTLGQIQRVANTDLLGAIRAEGLLAVTAGDNVLRLAPPLIIDEHHVEEALGILGRACDKLAGSR